jgi:hypothetical protein
LAQDISEQTLKLRSIFLPYAGDRTKRAKENNIRFVHYTSADVALRIFREARVIMRSTLCMNDYLEFEHGLQQLVNFFRPEASTRAAFFNAVNECGANLAEDAIKVFDQWLPHNRSNLYVTCLSEHENDEDTHGRLSMWRAYSRGSVGVAIVLKNDPFWLESDSLNIFASPVAYLRKDSFDKELLRVVENIKTECSYLKAIERERVTTFLFWTLIYAAACTKHPGFAEEREWRILYFPKLWDSKILERSVENINGVPQPVYKIPLKNVPAEGIIGIEIPEILDRIIIGPSSFPWPLYDAFVSVLKDAGVADAEKKVTVSDIPLRT